MHVMARIPGSTREGTPDFELKGATTIAIAKAGRRGAEFLCEAIRSALPLWIDGFGPECPIPGLETTLYLIGAPAIEPLCEELGNRATPRQSRPEGPVPCSARI